MLLALVLSSTLLASTRVRVIQNISGSSSTTFAQTTRQEIKSTVVENRCERVTSRVNEHARAGEVVKDNRARIHQGVVKRLQALFTKLKDNGCDTATAESNLDTWEDMITTYRDQFNDWLNALHGLQNKVCQENTADYKASLQAVHDKRKVAQDTKREISRYYLNTLKPSVRALRTSCKETQ